DEWRAYRSLRRRRRGVRHGAGNYVDGRVHTNSMESFWAIVKRTVLATYHWISWKHLHRYVAEFTGRFNNRLHDDLEQMRRVRNGLSGSRLRYADLVA
ncbi:MAG: transposase, partial [Chloroflexi bacterium]|nr:transposase [Chloroflexota bacterium]